MTYQPAQLNRRTQPALLLLIVVAGLLSACAGLAGDAQIVATVTPDASEVLPPDNPDVAAGSRIFAANCTQCHGENGDGNGVLVQSGEVPRMVSFIDASSMAQASPVGYYHFTTVGNIENLMPPWRDALTDQQRWDVTAYLFSLLDSQRDVADAASLYQPDLFGASVYTLSQREWAQRLPDTLTDEQKDELVVYARQRAASDPVDYAEPGSTVTFSISLSNGTADGIVPDGTVVALNYGNVDSGFEQATTTAQDSAATFADIPVVAGNSYIASSAYGGITFVSEILPGNQLTDDTALSVELYDSTGDASQVVIRDIDWVVNALAVPEVGNGLQVTQTFTYENTSDRVFTTDAAVGNGRFATLLLQLPVGSVVLSQDPRYIVASDQFAVIDTLPVMPGENTVQLTYYVPYEDGAVIDMPLNNRFDGMLRITLVPANLRLVLDESAVYSEADDTIEIPLQIAARDNLVFEIRGDLFGTNTSDDTLLVTSDRLVPILLIGVVLLALLALVVVRLIGRNTSHSQVSQQTEQLTDELEKLERQHDLGQISHDVYQREKVRLTAQLQMLLKRQDAHDPAADVN